MAAGEIVYGVNPVIELLRAGRRRCHEILVAAGRREKDVLRIEQETVQRKVKLRSVAREELTRVAQTDWHQGVVARVDPYPYAELHSVLAKAFADPERAFLLLLDGITDPQNLGAIIRTAHLMGVHGVILPKDKSASITAAVVKASAGATEYMEIVQVTNLVTTIDQVKEAGGWVFGAASDDKNTIYNNKFADCHVALVLGAEGQGLRRLVREHCDQLLSIPMKGRIDSYNVSVAGALFMGEVMRQREVQVSGVCKNHTQRS